MPRGPRSRPAHLAQARAFEGINHVFIGGCSAVVRKNSVTHRKARGSIRDAIRRGSDWHGSHRIPRGAAWTLQQLRETTGFERRYDYLLHDRDSIFAQHLDESVKKLGITVLKSPPRSPMANAICERVIGTIRRECLDWLIPLSASHLRSILQSWIPITMPGA